MWKYNFIETLIQDLRYGLRVLLKNPGFSAIVMLTLALGIGANTVVFSLLDTVLLKMLPVKQPEQLVLFRWTTGANIIAAGISTEMDGERDQAAGPKTGTSFSYPAFELLRAQNQSLSSLFAFGLLPQVNVSIDGRAEVAVGQVISGNYFTGLGLSAFLGRILTNDDDRSGANPAAVISYGYWQRRFGGDQAVVGKVIYLGGTGFTIVGVTPPEFYGTFDVGNVPDISAPLALLPQVMPQSSDQVGDPKYWWLRIIGRLKPGVTTGQAQSEFNLVMQQHVAELQNYARGRGETLQLDLASGSQGLIAARRRFSEPLRLLMTIVVLVLTVACLNIANLLLARSVMRRKEVAVRLAAGASRSRLVRQLLTESLLLAVLGGALGLAFAYWGKDALLALRPLEGAARLPDLKLDLRVLGFTAAVTTLTGILFGLVPSLRATKINLNSAFKESTGHASHSRSRLSKGLIVAQIAMSLVLLISAGLFVRTLRNLTRMDVGFNRENLLLFTVNPAMLGYKGDQLAMLYQRLIERIQATPGVRSATASDNPLLGGVSTSSFCVPGYTPQSGERMNVPRLYVGPNFFETMEMPILEGRGLTKEDNEPMISALATLQRPEGTSPKDPGMPRRVAVINQALARKYFSNVDPIGSQFGFSNNCNDGGGVEIVGIVRDAKYGALKQEIRPTVYIPYVQPPPRGAPGRMTFTVRTAGDPAMMVGDIQEAVRAVESRLPLSAVKTQEEQIAELVSQSRLFASLSSFFGLLALILVAVGLYGVMSYTVMRRTHEIGVRMAMGAARGDVLRLVLRETFWLAFLGVAIGLLASLLATRLIASQLFGLAPHDPLTLALVVMSLMAVTMLAGYLPARRAAKVDPLIALRYE